MGKLKTELSTTKGRDLRIKNSSSGKARERSHSGPTWRRFWTYWWCPAGLAVFRSRWVSWCLRLMCWRWNQEPGRWRLLLSGWRVIGHLTWSTACTNPNTTTTIHHFLCFETIQHLQRCFSIFNLFFAPDVMTYRLTWAAGAGAAGRVRPTARFSCRYFMTCSLVRKMSAGFLLFFNGWHPLPGFWVVGQGSVYWCLLKSVA